MSVETAKEARCIVGRVVSNKMDKTLIVVLVRKVKHKLYRKYVSRTTKYYVHDENNSAQIGDLVKIMASRPLSKMKTWRLVSVLDKAGNKL